jgi:hypothetical protein
MARGEDSSENPLLIESGQYAATAAVRPKSQKASRAIRSRTSRDTPERSKHRPKHHRPDDIVLFWKRTN